MESETLTARKTQLKAALLELVKQHHRVFLQERKLSGQEGVFDRARTWHSDFPVHSVPPLTAAVLPIHPLAESALQSRQYLVAEEDDIQGNSLPRSFQLPEEEHATNEFSSNLLLKVLHSTYAHNRSKVQQKEKRQFEANSRSPKTPCAKGSAELKQIAASLKTCFSDRDVSSMYLAQLLDEVRANINGSPLSLSTSSYLGAAILHLSIDEISQLIEELSSLLPGWIWMIQHLNGTILKTDSAITLSEIFEVIDGSRN